MRWARVVPYRILYRAGVTPWERLPTITAGAQASEMLDREQDGHEPPYGKALDLGCGSGIWAVDLARCGWEVTGIDVTPKAVNRARERAREASGVEIRFIEGDVAQLGAADTGSGFRLVLDFGTVHGLSPTQRRAMGRELNAVTTDDAVLLMYATSLGHRWPLPSGISRADIDATYPGWKLTDEQDFDMSGTPGSFRRARPRWYRLQRVRAPATASASARS